MLTDDSPMPYGKYAKEKMANVPPDYLLWLYDNNKCGGDVKRYIEDNLSVLRGEIEYKKKQK